MDDTQHLRRGHKARFNPDSRWLVGYVQVLEELSVDGAVTPGNAIISTTGYSGQ